VLRDSQRRANWRGHFDGWLIDGRYSMNRKKEEEDGSEQGNRERERETNLGTGARQINPPRKGSSSRPAPSRAESARWTTAMCVRSILQGGMGCHPGGRK